MIDAPAGTKFTRNGRNAFGECVPYTTEVLAYEPPVKGGSTSSGNWVVRCRVRRYAFDGRPYETEHQERSFTKRGCQEWLDALLRGEL